MGNKSAMITGAAQGIGQATALRLASNGVNQFVLIDRLKEGMEETKSLLQAKGATASVLAADLTDLEGWKAQAEEALRAIGQVDVLVNAAGSTARGGLHDTDQATFDMLFDLNVRAPFFLMQIAAPFMPRGSVVVNICSMLAYGGPPFLLAYASSKAALVAMTKGAANTLKYDGVRVFGINLGWTWTPGEQVTQMQAHGLPEDWRETVGAKQPFGRLLMPDDPAGLIAFLASQDAQMMTGAIIDLDQFVAGTVDDNPGNS